MAQDSRRARKVRRLKRTISQNTRFAAQTNHQQRQRLEERLIHTQFALLAVLMEHGDADHGLAVAKETATLVMTDFAHLVWKVDTQEDGTLRVVFSDRRNDASGLLTPEQQAELQTDLTAVDDRDYMKNTTEPTASETNIPLAPRAV